MTYSKKARLDRRSSIMVAVKKELKANNAFVAPELLRTLAESLDTAKFYGIEVIRDAEEAAEKLRLKDRSTQHSWAGGDGIKQEGEVICGSLSFGEDHFYEFFDNGDSTGPTEYEKNPEFNLNEAFIVTIETHDWNDRDRDCCNHDDWCTTIVVYTPEVLYDEVEYTARKDAELAELCQLR